MNCEVCYHKKVCGKIQREGCADFKDEEKVFEVELPLGTPYYTIEKRYFCDVADDEDFGDCPDEAVGADGKIDCEHCSYNFEVETIVKNFFTISNYSFWRSNRAEVGTKYWFSYDEAARELERRKENGRKTQNLHKDA